jgi:phosphoglycerate kinase
MNLRTITDADIAGKIVLYRVDYNMPLDEAGEITDPRRIVGTYPTIDYMREQGAKIVIVSHMGRPKGEDMTLSLRPVVQYLADHYAGTSVHLAKDPFDPAVKEMVHGLRGGDILVLENIRFFAGEEDNDENLGKALADLADVYVNDAFACAHRAHASIVGPTHYLPSYAGLLIQKEVDTLGEIMQSPEHPFVVVMGGAKVTDKLGILRALGPKADQVLIGGATASAFVQARGESIGASFVEAGASDAAKQVMKELGDKLHIAVDFVIDGVGEEFKNMDVGPETVIHFSEILRGAKTVLWNGTMGMFEDPRYRIASQQLLELLAGLEGCTTIVAGGDSAACVTELGLDDKISFISTGGGAALEFLSGEKLPGIEALLTK